MEKFEKGLSISSQIKNLFLETNPKLHASKQ
jgi:hypothetical protein